MKRIVILVAMIVLCSQLYAVTVSKVWVASEPILAADLNDNFLDVASAIDDSGFPSGMIVIWSGSSANIPSGWVLCDGSNGTPNLSGKFILSHGGSYSAGDTGGLATGTYSSTATSTAASSHSHAVDILSGTPGNGTESAAAGTDLLYTDHQHMISGDTGDSGTHTHQLTATGSISILPPFYVLCYIMKL